MIRLTLLCLALTCATFALAEHFAPTGDCTSDGCKYAQHF